MEVPSLQQLLAVGYDPCWGQAGTCQIPSQFGGWTITPHQPDTHVTAMQLPWSPPICTSVPTSDAADCESFSPSIHWEVRTRRVVSSWYVRGTTICEQACHTRSDQQRHIRVQQAFCF